MTELIGKLPLVGLLLGFAGFLGWDYYNFMNAPDSPLVQKKQQYVAIQAAYKASTEALKKAKSNQEELEAHRQKTLGVAQQLEQVGASLAQEIDTSSLIKSFATEAKKTGLQVDTVVPKAERAAELYVEQSFDVAYSGAFVQLLMFLNRVSSLERIVRIDEFEVHRKASRSKIAELTGNLVLKAYKYTGLKEKPKANKPAAPASAAPAAPPPAPGGDGT